MAEGPLAHVLIKLKVFNCDLWRRTCLFFLLFILTCCVFKFLQKVIHFCNHVFLGALSSQSDPKIIKLFPGNLTIGIGIHESKEHPSFIRVLFCSLKRANYLNFAQLAIIVNVKLLEKKIEFLLKQWCAESMSFSLRHIAACFLAHFKVPPNNYSN